MDRATDEGDGAIEVVLMNNRGFLRNFPPDVVARVSGVGGVWYSVTRADVLGNKRARQRRELAARRRVYSDVIRPCFIWTFYNLHFPFMGWHFYIRSLRHSWQIRADRDPAIILDAMQLYPCGLLPILENFELWKATFAEWYPRVTEKRSERQGMAVARARVDGGWVVEVVE